MRLESTGGQWLEKAIEDQNINLFDFNEFVDSEVIGRGAFGIIYKSLWEDCQLTVALKSLTGNEDLISEDFVKELRLLQRVSFHPNIIQFYGVTKRNPSTEYSMVLQYANNGDLRNFLSQNFATLQWTDKFRIAEEIALGILFLHTNNIVHLDLHSKNILVHEGKMMIADFGLSRNENSIPSSMGHGIPAYKDPQSFLDFKYKRNKKSDIYSLGVILWEISSGRPPFESVMPRDAVVIQVYKGKRETPIENTPENFVELYKRCWDTNPENRPDAEFVHEALENLISGEEINFSDLPKVIEIRPNYLKPPNVNHSLVTSNFSLSNEIEDTFIYIP